MGRPGRDDEGIAGRERRFDAARLDPQRAARHVDELLAVVALLQARLPRGDGQGADRQVLGADEQADEDVAIELPDGVGSAENVERSGPGTRVAEGADDAVDRVPALLEVRTGSCVRTGRAGGGRRREELEDAQRLVPVRESVMPGVAPEEDALPGLRPHDLAGLRVREDERALEDMEQLVGGEHRSEALRVPERAARR